MMSKYRGEDFTVSHGYLAPAPWRLDPESYDKEFKDSISVKDAKNGTVCIFTRGYEADENGDGCPSWSNARLTAAAPDLLKACELAEDALRIAADLIASRFPQHTAASACIELARREISAAIDKRRT